MAARMFLEAVANALQALEAKNYRGALFTAEKARDAFDIDLIECDDEVLNASARLGEISCESLSMLGQHDDAIAQGLACVQHFPHRWEGPLTLARAFQRARRFDEARTWAGKAYQLCPTNMTVFIAMKAIETDIKIEQTNRMVNSSTGGGSNNSLNRTVRGGEGGGGGGGGGGRNNISTNEEEAPNGRTKSYGVEPLQSRSRANSLPAGAAAPKSPRVGAALNALSAVMGSAGSDRTASNAGSDTASSMNLPPSQQQQQQRPSSPQRREQTLPNDASNDIANTSSSFPAAGDRNLALDTSTPPVSPAAAVTPIPRLRPLTPNGRPSLQDMADVSKAAQKQREEALQGKGRRGRSNTPPPPPPLPSSAASTAHHSSGALVHTTSAELTNACMAGFGIASVGFALVSALYHCLALQREIAEKLASGRYGGDVIRGSRDASAAYGSARPHTPSDIHPLAPVAGLVSGCVSLFVDTFKIPIDVYASVFLGLLCWEAYQRIAHSVWCYRVTKKRAELAALYEAKQQQKARELAEQEAQEDRERLATLARQHSHGNRSQSSGKVSVRLPRSTNSSFAAGKQ